MIVQPGEEFSLNEHVGPRTREKGYVAAPMILRGEIVDSVGGGVSQFATTFFNAVFYGCYEDVDHKPHSYYFSRYPEVNEATISWPTPHLIFRNNTDAVVIIKTQYTNSSITVKFFGNNDGKTCERRLGKRYGFRAPPVEYEEDASLDPTEEVVVQSGADGWANTVVRVITHKDGTVEEEQFTWTYSARPRILRVHPCNVPDSTVECPIQVPNVVGMSQGDASAALQGAGFAVSIGGLGRHLGPGPRRNGGEPVTHRIPRCRRHRDHRHLPLRGTASHHDDAAPTGRRGLSPPVRNRRQSG